MASWFPDSFSRIRYTDKRTAFSAAKGRLRLDVRGGGITVGVAMIKQIKFVSIPVADQNRALEDRKSTRLNSSHSQISYAVFCLKKKNTNAHIHMTLAIIVLFLHLLSLVPCMIAVSPSHVACTALATDVSGLQH